MMLGMVQNGTRVMRLGELLQNVDVLETSGDLGVEVTGIEYDSRRVQPGALFVAVSGEHVDGRDFTGDAVLRGAVAVLSETGEGFGDAVRITVADARLALAQCAAAFYAYPGDHLATVGITGTNGKTTVGFMVRDILVAAGRRPGLLGTVRYEIGERVLPAARTTPEAADIQQMLASMLRAGCDSVSMEVSSHALVQYRAWGIPFEVGLFTNLTQDHLDYHGTMEQYFAAKVRLFSQVKESGHAVINLDDPWGRKLIDEHEVAADVVTFGFNEQAMVSGCDAKVSPTGSRMRVTSPWGEAEIALSLMGRFNLNNALAAFAAAGSLGIPVELIANALSEMKCVPGRLERIGKRNVFVDYAHTDDALQNVLSALREITPGRLVVVFGCGGNRDQGKRRKMGEVAARLADYSVITNDNPRREIPEKIAADIASGFDSERKFETVLDRASAMARGLELIGRNDTLLVAGKGHETYQEFDGTIVPFDDREVLRSLI